MGGEGRKGWRERRRRGREAKGAESGPRVRPAEWAPRGWWVAGGWRATSCQPQGGRPSVSRWPAPVSVACASVWRRRRPANEQPISRAESPHAPSAPWCDLGRPLALSLSQFANLPTDQCPPVRCDVVPLRHSSCVLLVSTRRNQPPPARPGR